VKVYTPFICRIMTNCVSSCLTTGSLPRGFRSFDRQEALYKSGRFNTGPILTKALPGESFHNYGLASDWGFVEYPHFSAPGNLRP
jgi:LAS superfamily LD-carboxypeptidase LdcB